MVELKTERGYDYWELLSALQKDIRRGREYEALFWAAELETFNPTALWNRLKVIASEDVGIAFPLMPVIIDMLNKQYLDFKAKSDYRWRLFLANAVLQLARCPKSRMVDDLLNVVYYEIQFEDKKIPIPEYALDMHTKRGKNAGRGLKHFFEEASKLENETSRFPNLYTDRAKELAFKYGLSEVDKTKEKPKEATKSEAYEQKDVGDFMDLE